LQFVSTYVHLNPARAGLIRIGEDKLKTYRWSSYPGYLNGKAPHWLNCVKVLGSLGLKEADWRGYEAYMEGRVLELGLKAGRQELEEQWKMLRRGWYVGNEIFLNKLEKWLDKAVKGRKRQSQSGGARETHDAVSAERAAVQRHIRAGTDDQSNYWPCPKARPGRPGLWLVGDDNAVALLSERLHMGTTRA
jgi:hypothetical protein